MRSVALWAVGWVVAVGPALAIGGGSWQGEWGTWTPTATGELRGASVSIDCDPSDGCRARFEVETAAGMCTVSEPVALEPGSDGTAAATLQGVGGETKQCRLVLAPAVSEQPAITARLEGADCGYFCTAGPLPLGRLPRASVAPYPVAEARACFADRRAARQLWCTTPALRERERALVEIETALEELTHTPTAGRDARIAAAVTDCQRTDVESTIVPCLEQHVERELAERKGSLAAARSAHASAEAELTAPGDAAASEKVIASVHGVYKRRFENGLVDGSSFESENVLELVPVRPGTLYFRTHLEFYNGHTCDLWGLASWRRAGVFLYEGPTLDEDPPCRLQIAVTDRDVRLIDADQTCKTFCGARGSFDGESFARGARREIRYLDRLKKSREYREALGEVVR